MAVHRRRQRTDALAAREHRPPTTTSQKLVPPRPETKLAIEAATAAHAARPRRFQAKVDVKNATELVFGPGHSDEIGWSRHFLATFGTTSSGFATLEVNRMAEALRAAGKITEQDINAALAVLSGQNPKDEIEAMLLAQMAVTHALFMRKAGHLGRSEQIPQQDSNGLALMRLSKAFASQLDALAKLRRGGEQLVRVEHVHVHSGGQAIVGRVTHNGGGTAPEKDGQAHASGAAAPAIEGSSAMWREDPKREAVPVSRRSR